MESISHTGWWPLAACLTTEAMCSESGGAARELNSEVLITGVIE